MPGQLNTYHIYVSLFVASIVFCIRMGSPGACCIVVRGTIKRNYGDVIAAKKGRKLILTLQGFHVIQHTKGFPLFSLLFVRSMKTWGPIYGSGCHSLMDVHKTYLRLLLQKKGSNYLKLSMDDVDIFLLDIHLVSTSICCGVYVSFLSSDGHGLECWYLKLTRRVATYHPSSTRVGLLRWVRARTDFHSAERDANNVNICQVASLLLPDLRQSFLVGVSEGVFVCFRMCVLQVWGKFPLKT